MNKKERRRYGVARLRELKDAAIILDLETMDVALKNILTDEVMTLFEKCKIEQMQKKL